MVDLKTVLLIDDDIDLQQLTKIALKSILSVLAALDLGFYWQHFSCLI